MTKKGLRRGGGRLTHDDMPFGDIANLYTQWYNPFAWISGVYDVYKSGDRHNENAP
jgi:hypothetical protein